ncbi:hypothetical protein HBI37_193000 [Parastagonospora nodorum]|nr:hypothetical protein HBH50_222640 [Parastagonospora nodorum]KAH4082799.1 hypothetical protein HBH48_183340 [Parastagonospora nodorum]KAH5172899.1 hypothetical protein HBH77_215920 [Parastagonospora nodorum]KAH5344924.1 hypothetical protein HBI48_206020 [Parastagonospora nodorum]KAH5398376.1 hypothetical protein HBI47_207110 [Parastagonospora nodorum]
MLSVRVLKTFTLYCTPNANPSTYDHRTMKTRLPVRSAIYKHRTGGLVVKWVTISESPLLYVFTFFSSTLLIIFASVTKWIHDSSDAYLLVRRTSLYHSAVKQAK